MELQFVYLIRTHLDILSVVYFPLSGDESLTAKMSVISLLVFRGSWAHGAPKYVGTTELHFVHKCPFVLALQFSLITRPPRETIRPVSINKASNAVSISVITITTIVSTLNANTTATNTNINTISITDITKAVINITSTNTATTT